MTYRVGRWREDAKIHRHDCGGWVYSDDPCGTCDPAEAPVVPIRSTPAVDGGLQAAPAIERRPA